MNKFSQLLRTRNAAGQPRPIDLGALLTLDSDAVLSCAEGLLLALESRAKGLTTDDAKALDELATMAGESLEAARESSEKTTVRATEATAGHVHAALVAIGDGALFLLAAGRLHTTAAKQGLDPKVIFEKRRGGAR